MILYGLSLSCYFRHYGIFLLLLFSVKNHLKVNCSDLLDFIFIIDNAFADLPEHIKLKRPFFLQNGCGRSVEMFDWDGNLIWDFTYERDKYLVHNDIEPLPNGNILMTVWAPVSSRLTCMGPAGFEPATIWL